MLGSLDLAAAVLLLAAGPAKIITPREAAGMLRRAVPRLPAPLHSTTAVRLGGAAETAIGLAVVITGSRPALALLAGCYAAFAAVATRLAAVGPGTACGCFGRADSPVGLPHVLLNVIATAVAVAGAVAPPGPVGGWLDADTLPALTAIGQSILLAYLGYLSITALPALLADRRRVSA